MPRSASLRNTLNSYRGTLSEIIFARFFVLRARVLKEMRLLIRNPLVKFVNKPTAKIIGNVGCPNMHYYLYFLCGSILKTKCESTIFIGPLCNWCLILTKDLTNKMLVHVNKNYIIWFVFEHSFQWCNFLWHAWTFG